MTTTARRMRDLELAAARQLADREARPITTAVEAVELLVALDGDDAGWEAHASAIARRSTPEVAAEMRDILAEALRLSETGLAPGGRS